MAKGGRSYALLVDDEPQISEVCSTILEAEGYRVVCASDGAESLRVLQTEPGRPALILADLTKSRMGGFEVCRRLAAIHRGGSALHQLLLLGRRLSHRHLACFLVALDARVLERQRRVTA